MARAGFGRALWPSVSVAAFVAMAALVDRSAWPRDYPAAIPPGDEPEILGAIHDFNLAYQDFFATAGKTALLDAVPATKEVKHYLFRDIGWLRRAQLLMVQDHVGATLLESRLTAPDVAEVLVFEEWNWTLQREGDRKLVTEIKGLGQGFRYRLEREKGRWVVAWWEVEDIAPPPVDEGRKW